MLEITNLAAKAAVNAKATQIEKKNPDTASFITIPEFNRLTRLSFDVKV